MNPELKERPGEIAQLKMIKELQDFVVNDPILLKMLSKVNRSRSRASLFTGLILGVLTGLFWEWIFDLIF